MSADGAAPAAKKATPSAKKGRPGSAMRTRVAVLMAAYNAERTLKQAVDSVLHGTYPCCVYIVDDGSRIPVSETLGDYDRERIKVIRLDRNVGPSAARNK